MPAHPVPTPRAAAATAVRMLRALADPVRAEGARRYFRKFAPVHLFGVAAPEVRRTARDLVRRVRGAWGADEALAFCEICVRRRELETKVLGFVVLGRFVRDLPPGFPARPRRWALGGLCANWATTDALAGEVLGPFLRLNPDRVAVVTAWHASSDLWLRRLAVVPLVPLARRGEALDAAYGVVGALLGDTEDLIHKACGWLLREAGKTDPARLERFLREHGPAIPRTTVRYAIERFPAARRTALLAATRGSGGT